MSLFWWLDIICLSVVTVYLSVSLVRKNGRMWAFAIPLLLAITGIAVWRWMPALGLVILEGVGFAMLHLVSERVSWTFFVMFYLVEIGLCVMSGLLPPEAAFMKDAFVWIMTMTFFLAENNQNFLRRSYEESMNEYQNSVMKKQVDEVQNLYMTMRGWRHDYHNHLQAVKAQLSMGQTDLANEYLGRLEQDLDDIRQLVESGNVSLDAILNSKLSYAIKQDIKVNYKATVPRKLTVSDIDLCIIIGNLIDNGVEACEKLPASDRFIRLYIGIFRSQLYISVSNSTNEVVKKLDDEYITTKRGNHGHGLKRINNTVEKYNGYVNRKNEPGVFATEIMLPL